jgi:hypothetical protein
MQTPHGMIKIINEHCGLDAWAYTAQLSTDTQDTGTIETRAPERVVREAIRAGAHQQRDVDLD